MMPSEYVAKDGTKIEFDLDSVIDVIDGWSGLRSGWQAFIIYEPQSNAFVELASTVPDIRGNSTDESFEVDDAYVGANFGLTQEQLERIRKRPSEWEFTRARSAGPTSIGGAA